MALSLQFQQAEGGDIGDAGMFWRDQVAAASSLQTGVLKKVQGADGQAGYQVVYLSAGVGRLLRLPLVVGHRLEQLLPASELGWLPRLEEVLLTGRRHSMERRAGPLSRWLWAEFSALDGAGGQLIGVTLLDITQRKQRELETIDKKMRYRALVDGLPLPVWVLGSEGQAQFVNSVFERFFDMDWRREKTLDWARLLHAEDLQGYLYDLEHALRERSELNCLVRGRRNDGQWRWLEINAMPRYSRLGRFMGLAGNCRDVTDRRELEQANAQLLRGERTARTVAESTARLKDEFMATISHELRTPLTTVLGWSEMLLQRMSPDDPAYKGMKVIATSAQALKRLIGDMLDLSGMLLGKLKLDMEVLDLAAEVRDAVRSLDLAAMDRKLDVRVSVPESACPVLADQTRIQQVLWNLLSNAAKFSDEGGVIDISLRREGNSFVLDIRDSGVGIAPEFLPFLFSRFRQADGTTTRRYGGLGLGLSIVQQLVDLHGGTVSAASEGIGEGARFSVTLPALLRSGQPPRPRRGSRQNQIQAVGTDSDALANLRLLLVDDQREILDLLRQSLERHGAQVHTATSSAEALRMIGSGDHARYDVVLSDIGMPGMDGYGLVRTIREDLGLPASVLPVIAVTALARADDRQQALDNGFQAHVTKPCNLAVLLAEIRGVLAR